ncbi:protein FAR1-RELATED SEQUENCE 6-like [Phoenix dactylifera]|uniref:Protein FAR1-RELATED SEQUENCE n=1 Tax=Phoenix dactylifera TaxID=42345 RepID=A0A8B7BW61_PHODC|nr:protein FAR1-RELATED SEQUENCE 6-like [Phoenix dactylifera]XP_008786608.2 protein FAR1-RELATED SEQUENCE 6-like [Phoenix dactylifera]XP_008786609.2 protein FAR1-RELATED SEQUENCE 6-like [Phoenix dactylifera]XP_026659576.2 protein FAR1-RELATED SEQUENCE 6-like [Phoenix dactylifera]XP_038985429.1 protein FAR1-RELATED SEQUENCE 6-like [Phoenix dactylifera]XP_038985431.1 protein FAR1-RELATED SEQUENCE 6-like [Phoenix dactylifera]
MGEPLDHNLDLVPVSGSSIAGEEWEPHAEKVHEPIVRGGQNFINEKIQESIVGEGLGPVAKRGQQPHAENVPVCVSGSSIAREGWKPNAEKVQEPIVRGGQNFINEKGKDCIVGEGPEPVAKRGQEPLDKNVLEPAAEEEQEPITENEHEFAAGNQPESVAEKEQEIAQETILGDDSTPRVGMTFKSPEEAFRFYDQYACRTGFGIKILHSMYYKDGRCRYLMLSCNRDGKVNYKSEKVAPKTNCNARFGLVCHKDGLLHVKKAINDHNHPLTPGTAHSHPSKKRKQYLGDIDGDRMLSDKLCQEHGSTKSRKQGAGDNKCKLRLVEGDGEALCQFFVVMQTKNSCFFHSIYLDEEGCLKNVFWADGRSRIAYRYFGDVVLFDSTFLISKFDLPLVSIVGVNHHGQLVLLGCALLSDETSETYTWLFKTWLSCMLGQTPTAIITDRNRAIQQAVAKVFPRARHRQCMWHILKRHPENLQGCVQYKEIKKTFKKVVYNSLTANEFEEDWRKMVEKYGLGDNEWIKLLYEDRHCWAPVFVKDTFWAGMSVTLRGESMNSFFQEYIDCKTSLQQFLSEYEVIMQSKHEKEVQADLESQHQNTQLITQIYMEQQLCKVYTIDMFKKFQEEIKALVYCVSSLIKVDGRISIFEVQEHVRAKDGKTMEQKRYEVRYDENELEIACICCSFQFRGILCRHALSVLHFRGVAELSSNYILQRWRKDFKQMHSLNCFPNQVVVDGTMECHEIFRNRCLKLAEIGMMLDEKHEFAAKVVNEAIQKLLSDDSTCEDTQPETLSLEATTNCDMVSFSANDNRDVGNENHGIHDPLQVSRQIGSHPHFQFFQDRVQAGQQSTGYRSGAEWSFQQYFHDTQILEAPSCSRPW